MKYLFEAYSTTRDTQLDMFNSDEGTSGGPFEVGRNDQLLWLGLV
jgi:hypothetical protein